MNVSKSIDFLLDNAGDVIKYRLHKEILKDLSKCEEENLLERVKQTPYYKLIKSYVKPNGYIGIGMHSWEKFKETPLQDGESAARLLSNYSIPKDSPIVKNYIAAIRNEKVLEDEFSYYNPEIARFQNRYLGLKNGGGLMTLIYTMQALLGYGDDNEEVKSFADISYHAFESMLTISSMEDITKFNPNLRKKYNYPYVEEDVYLPCSYHLTMLSRTASWRNNDSIKNMAEAINHMNRIMKDDNNVFVKIGSKYYVPLWAFVRPFKEFNINNHHTVMRRTLTEIAMLGIGDRVEVIKRSADNVKDAISLDGILRVNFTSSYQKKRFIDNFRYPGPYSEVGLETDYKKEVSIWCDLTFWAVQFLYILEQNKGKENTHR